MKYFPRLQEPDELNPCYTYLPQNCLKFENGSVLSNCVGYTIGRIIEICGEQYNFVGVNAGDFYDYHKSLYEHGQIPKLGAIACWDNHIANVEEIGNGYFTVSQSHYNGVRFDLETITKASGYSYRGHKFLGFIYLPINFENDPGNVKPVCDTCNYEPYDDKYYRVRKTWEDARSQVGAYKYYENAKAKAIETGLHCYDAQGRQVI